MGGRIWRNLRVLIICFKTRKIAKSGVSGAIIMKYNNLGIEEVLPKTKLIALAVGHASAIKLKNAKTTPHSMLASGREHKDGDDDGGDGDDADGSGAN
jgi:hypothetical protein